MVTRCSEGEGVVTHMSAAGSSSRVIDVSYLVGDYQPLMDTSGEDPNQVERSSQPCPRSKLPLLQRGAYGVGHVFNDMCASMWFTYFILYFHSVLRIPNLYAGVLVLIGQTADGLATPVVGYLCDKTENWYGGRKTWHFIGTVCVSGSFFFFWHSCIYCTNQVVGWQILYFASFIVVFQFGWASVQISHLALIPELTPDKNERVVLNAIRNAATIFSNIAVFVVLLILLFVVAGTDLGNTTVSPHDEWLFSGAALGVIVVGSMFSLFFHLFTREPSARRHRSCPDSSSNNTANHRLKVPWYSWLKRLDFYLIAVIYMGTRLVVNLVQVYAPLYILDSLNMYKVAIAVGPLVLYISGLASTFTINYINKWAGQNVAYFVGLVLVWIGLVWCYLWPLLFPHDEKGMDINGHQYILKSVVYVPMAFLGLGGSAILVTALSMVSNLIGDKSGSGAVVYGAMSFTDKISNGIAIQVIQALHPCKDVACCPQCASYYRNVLGFVPLGASLIAFIALIALVVYSKWSLSSSSEQQSKRLSTSPEKSAIHHPRFSDYGSLTTSASDHYYPPPAAINYRVKTTS